MTYIFKQVCINLDRNLYKRVVDSYNKNTWLQIQEIESSPFWQRFDSITTILYVQLRKNIAQHNKP
jgi:hypothetical protein